MKVTGKVAQTKELAELRNTRVHFLLSFNSATFL